MLSVEEARERILSYFSVLPAEERPLLEALGMTLAEDVYAPFDVPPLANSAMDGYAVRAGDVAGAAAATPVTLPVISSVAAGQLPDRPLAPGTAIRIMTGAPLPAGADAVVPFEDTDEQERLKRGGPLDRVSVRVPSVAGANIRPAGEDIREGTLVLKEGTLLRPGEIGVMASLGHKAAKVIRRPVVAIVSTGDELLEPGQPHQAGKIYNSNAYSIGAAVQKYGGAPVVVGIARDTIEALQAALDNALAAHPHTPSTGGNRELGMPTGGEAPRMSAGREGMQMQAADMVVTSAGVSKGDYDIVKDVLSQRGKIALWSVRMRPAKPLAFGTLDAPDGRKVPHLGLPGNPVSAMVAFEQFGRPAIHKMMGRAPAPKPTVQAVLDDPITNHDGRRVYARVAVYRDSGGAYRARTTGTQSSGALTSMALANGLAICPEDIARLEPGDVATVEMLDWPDSVF
jgi:molybdopterin molybdotransferase